MNFNSKMKFLNFFRRVELSLYENGMSHLPGKINYGDF